MINQIYQSNFICHVLTFCIVRTIPLRLIFGPKRGENAEWRRLHNQELHSLYCSPNINMIKSRRLRWTGHVVRMEEGKSAFKIVTGKHKRRVL